MKVIPTKIPNLVQDGDTGIFYARTKVAGLNKYRSLETDKVTTAKLRLPDKLKEIREVVSARKPVDGLSAKSTFAEVVEVYRAQVQALSRLEATTKHVRLRPERTLLRNWPDVFKIEIRRIDSKQIEKFMSDYEQGKFPYRPIRSRGAFRGGNKPSTVNKTIAFLRNVFDVAVKAHVIGKNPAAQLTYLPPTKKLLNLPNKTQFAKMIEHIRRTAGKGRIAADLVEGLAYSGLRVEESQGLRWVHLDHERLMFTVPGTKTLGSARVIPMIHAFAQLTLLMKDRRETVLGRPVAPTESVFEAGAATTSLAKACVAVGVQKMTHHDLRHLFATTCIEAGVDIPTVAGWLGHVDGGALAMQTYGHIRPAHSIEAAKKVSFV